MRKFLLVLVVLALVGVAADRVAHRLATDQAESRLAAHGLAAATVEVGGFPFLDQLVLRQFDEVRVSGTSLRTDAGSAGRVTLTASDVTAPSGGLVTVRGLSGRGTIRYAEVLRQVGVDGLRLRDGGNGTVRLRRDVTVLGRTLTATAVGRVEAHGQRVRVVPESVEFANGNAMDSRLAQSLAARFSFDYHLPDLPRGVAIRRVVPGADGFVVTVSGRDVSFSAVD